ncbi:colicin release lysis protein, partial [Escherichia coli]|nr:colicin release lysis protein [Escherichia coli]EFM1838387.1 colicin release lysis protein [Escherichia coli]EIG5112927.1 colicin release lysis protein [Escherichia coli]EIG9880320.1 colicin release lysis protein [Escherichia coli]EII7660990.1 colicin release lysis protein [Escherichia coli]
GTVASSSSSELTGIAVQ